MKKMLKFVAYAIGAVVTLALLLVLTLPLWLGPVAKPTVRTVVPQFTGTSFELGHLYLNPYTGRLEVGGLVIGNPPGYNEPVAVSLSNMVFDVAMSTLGDKYVHVEEITIDGLFASYLNGGENDVDNFTQIQYNVAGSKEKFEEAKKRSEAEKEAAEEVEEAAEEVAETKFVIDRLTVRNVKVRYGFLTIPVPVDIVLTDIGKESDGATLSDVCKKVWEAILKSAGAVSDFVGSGATKTIDAVGDGATKTIDAVSEGAKKTADAVKGLLKF